MAKAPAFQFYPGDWLKDPELRICSHFARGLLVDLLCIMFEAKFRGRLVCADGETPWTDQQIVDTSNGATREEKLSALNELLRHGVLKRDSKGVVYSARMVRDEEIRQERAAAGSKGGSKTQAKHQANDEANDQAKSGSSSSSSSSSSDLILSHTHAGAWKQIPFVADKPDLQDAIAFWLANWPSINGGPQSDEIRIETRLAEAIDAGWSADKIVRSIRFSVNRCAKRWLDPDDDWSQTRRNGRSGKRPISIEDGR